MDQLNEIEPDDIKRLNADQLVRLLHILLHAEARDRLVEKHGIFVPFQINVPDGGRDGRWNAAISECEYIPRNLTYYQCKASYLGNADCRNELLRQDVPGDVQLKEKVAEVLEQGGAYVFFSSHPCVPIDERITASRDALRDAGRQHPENDCIEFLDANHIADWVNLHAAAFAYVCQVTGTRQPVGLRSLAAWGEDPIFRFRFQLNDYLSEHIRSLRKWLAEPRQVARITGPSGLGKTRLGYEVFACPDLGDEQAREALANSVVYTDCQIYRDVLGWIDQISTFGLSGIVVVDNCPRDWHHELGKMIARTNNKLSLLTLDYVAETVATGYFHVQLLPEKLRDVVPKILKSALPNLEESDVSHIAEFAQGFPLIAILTAQAGRALDYNALNEGKLADRLLWGREAPVQEAREIIRCLALFSVVGVSGGVANQLKFLLAEFFGGLSEYEFNCITRRFREMRIIQPAGDYIMVVPPPLAVSLAAQWLDDAPYEHVLRLVPGIAQNGLTEAFCHRLRQLDCSEKAEALSDRLMEPGAPLASAEVLNSGVGSQIFRALSEVNPLAATECVYRVFAQYSPEQSRLVTDGRRNLVWALEKLCWQAQTFQKATTVLLAFAAGENEKWANNATGHFQQLYHVHLSGTQCPAVDRLPVVKSGLQSGYPEVRKVCVQALGAALEYRLFSRSSGPEVRGTHLPEKDWEPTRYSEIWNYWKEVFQLLRDEITRKGDTLAMALDALGKNLGGILTCHLVSELESDFRVIALAQGGLWPSARESIQHVLTYQPGLHEDHRLIIKRWLNYVQPQDLKNRLVDVISTPSWQHEKDASGQYQDVAAKRASEIADELFQNRIDWLEFLPILLRGEQRQAWTFGARCAELSENPLSLIDRCLQEMSKLPKGEQNPQLVRGMLWAIRERKMVSEVLDRVAADENLRHLLVPLTTAARPSVEDFDRVVKLVESGKLPPGSLQAFAYGSIAPFSDNNFIGWLGDLIRRVPACRPAVFEIIAVNSLNDAAKWAACRSLIEELVISAEVVDAADAHLGWEWHENVKRILANEPRGQWICALTTSIVRENARESALLSLHDYFSDIVGFLLGQHYPLAWPILQSGLRDTRTCYHLVHVLGKNLKPFDNPTSPLWNLPVEELRKWAVANGDLVPLVLHFMSLYTVEKNETGGERFRWHPHALMLLEMGKAEDVESCVHANLFSYGSTGSRVPYIQKRIELISDLLEHLNPRIRNMAERLIRNLVADKEAEEKRDASRAAGIW